ncbi:glycosyl hydrolase family 18 protein [Leptospira wolffii]|uniref:glycosyl hydrolase family 18 protein n=1 Tax=Leptospira wolffii TaxID=409998 RepID=UPI0002F94FCF|nr:glycosyl hydrolase family 18 protein [Leptospira wolffii]EPG64686.1 glycoside hydrolase, family 18 domain protein [Leptospira wolffii serovar Khorat str. Khorat-H2]
MKKNQRSVPLLLQDEEMRGISRFLRQITFLVSLSLCPLSAQETEIWKYAVHQDLKEKPESYWEKELQSGVTLCFTGAFISKSAEIQHTPPPRSVLILGRNKQIRWIPLITFQNIAVGETVLGSEALRAKLRKNLEIFLSENNDYAGVHLDFEGLNPSYRGDYKELLIEIRPVFRESGKVLSLALFPQEEFSKSLAAFHSSVFRQNLADEVVLMAYDLHSPKTVAGPVTKFSWAEKNIDLLLQFYKPNQVWLGLPLYGYYWENGRRPPRLLTIGKDKDFAVQYGKESDGIRMIRTGRGEGSLILDNTRWKEYAKNLKLRGLAYWRLGF